MSHSHWNLFSISEPELTRESLSSSYAPPLPPKPQERFRSIARKPLPRPYSIDVPCSEPLPPPIPRRASGQLTPRLLRRFTESDSVFNTPKTSLSSLHGHCSTPQQQLNLSNGLTLQQLVKTYSDQFPLRIKVLQGYEGQTPQLCISNADMYNIHFLKHRKVVGIKDIKGHIYSVPLNSSLQFSLVYPSENGEPATFEKVSDILALDTLPKVVCATRAFGGSDKKTSVKQNEILVIKRVHKQKFKNKKGLEVLSLTTSEEKCLSADCRGDFSTDPTLVRMHLLEIVGYIPDPFPSQAVLFLSDDFMSCKQYLSSSLLAGTVTMIESKTETSLIASTVIGQAAHSPIEPNEFIDTPLLDIPLDKCLADVEVAVIQSGDTKSLYEDTRQLFQTLDIRKLKSFKDTGSAQTNDTQSFIYTAFKEGYERYGIELDISPAVYRYTELPSHSHSKGSEALPKITSDDEDTYEEIDFPSCSDPFSPFSPNVLSTPEPSMTQMSRTETTDAAEFETVSVNEDNPASQSRHSPTFEHTRMSTPPLPTYVTMRPASMDRLNPILDHNDSQSSPNRYGETSELRSALGLLTKRVESLEKIVRELVGSPPSVLTRQSSEIESNRTQLKKLTADKV